MAAVAAEVSDGNILSLLERFLTAGVMEDGVFKPTTIGTPPGGVLSPLLANIVLDRRDWQLHAAGYRFVRYADDFVVLCQTAPQAQEALALVRHVLEQELGLSLSPEKTQITTYGKGYDFLGFRLSACSRRRRDKSVLKFKSKIRELTLRHHNLDGSVIARLNRVIRGTANYFATAFSTCRWAFQKLDSWLRMRLRCMKLKRKNYHDNEKLRVGYFRRKLATTVPQKHRRTAGHAAAVEWGRLNVHADLAEQARHFSRFAFCGAARDAYRPSFTAHAAWYFPSALSFLLLSEQATHGGADHAACGPGDCPSRQAQGRLGNVGSLHFASAHGGAQQSPSRHADGTAQRPAK
jgi:hypothetical protein